MQGGGIDRLWRQGIPLPHHSGEEGMEMVVCLALYPVGVWVRHDLCGSLQNPSIIHSFLFCLLYLYCNVYCLVGLGDTIIVDYSVKYTDITGNS